MKQSSTVLVAWSYFGGKCIVNFTEDGYTVVSDTRKCADGYLHVFDQSADEITDACRDSILKYSYKHPAELPGLGASPQDRYFKGLSIKDRERIGNGGKAGMYNLIAE